MELIWSNDGVSTLLLPAKIVIFSEDREYKCTKNVIIPKNTMIIKKLVEKFVYFVNNLYFCKQVFVVKCKKCHK